MSERESDSTPWGFDIFNVDHIFSSGYYGNSSQYDVNISQEQYMGDSHYGSICSSVDADETIARALQEEFLQLSIGEASESIPAGDEYLQVSSNTQDCHSPSRPYYPGYRFGPEETYDAGPANSYSSDGDRSYDEESYSYDLEITDESELDGEVGKRLNQMVPIPHIPRINGDIPSVDEATSDHQRLLYSYMTWLNTKLKEMATASSVLYQIKSIAPKNIINLNMGISTINQICMNFTPSYASSSLKFSLLLPNMLLLAIFSASILFLSFYLVQASLSTKRKCHLGSLPGPLALPFIGHLHLLGPNMHQSFHKLSCRYGPLIQVRFGSQLAVVVSEPEVAKEFLKTHDLTFSSRPRTPAIQLLTYNASFAFAPHGPYWKFIKKLCIYELLGTRNLNHFRPLRAMEIRRFIRRLADKANAGEDVNVTEEVIKVTNNVISQMMFGLRCMDSEDVAEEARIVVRAVTKIFGEFDVSNVFWFFRSLDLQGIKKRSADTHRRYDALLEKIITERERVRKERKKHGEGVEAVEGDLLDMLIDVMEDENAELKFTRDHLKALILDFFTAGTETPSSAIDWTMAELINNPRVLKKAQEEINEVVGNQRLVEELDVPNLPYIQAIMKETFRLHPPAPLITRLSANECIINGYKIPAETMLFVNMWSIGKDSKYWECPLEFRPERFLATRDGENPMAHTDVRGHHFELLPFGTGRRRCPGMVLSMHELPTVVAAMIQCFDWKLPNPVDMSERPGLTTPRAIDLICSLVTRIDTERIISTA